MEKVYYIKHRPHSHKKRVFFLLVASAFLVCIIYLYTKPSPSVSAKKAFILSSVSASPTPQSDSLSYKIKSSLKGTHGEYAIVIKNLATDEEYLSSEHEKFYSASLYKLWVMATTLEQIKLGKLKEGDVLKESVETLNKKFNIASESAELTEGDVSFTVSAALEKMITISHNYAALLLTEKVESSTIAMFLKKNGFIESSIGIHGEVPTTTAYDTALFFKKLYDGQLIDRDSSSRMLNLLKKQRLNDKIPLYLPGNIVVAHKTGELAEYTHDGGIVYLPGNSYIITVLSKSDRPDLAEKRIADISKVVYTYFSIHSTL